MMTLRKFTVLEPALGIPGSELRFRGQWLQDAGFHPGARVELMSLETGVIEIRLIQPTQLTLKDFPTYESRSATLAPETVRL